MNAINAGIIHHGSGKLRCRNTLDGVRCMYRIDAHPAGGCPTRNARLERVQRRIEVGRYPISLDGDEVIAGAKMLEALNAGLDLRQFARTPAFRRFAATVLRAAKRAKAQKAGQR